MSTQVFDITTKAIVKNEEVTIILFHNIPLEELDYYTNQAFKMGYNEITAIRVNGKM